MADKVLWTGVPGNGKLQTEAGLTLAPGDVDFESAPAERAVLPTTPASIRQTYSRTLGGANSALGTTGVLGVSAIYLERGDVVNTINFWSATTAASVPLNQWAGLFTCPGGVILRLSADKTTEAWPGSTAKTFTLTSAYEVLTSGLYYIGLCQVATTLATLCCQGAGAGVAMHTSPPIMTGLSNSGLTTPASLGAGPITGPTPSASLLYGTVG
jgi:hypothetical protein